MSSAPTADELWINARWLVQAIDPNAGLVRAIEMSPESYRQASFLDDRILQTPRNTHLLNWNEVAKAKPGNARTDARWIFHIGHVGSTLIARLLGELNGVLSVREPRALRDVSVLSTDQRKKYVPALKSLLSRTFNENETALVKATSFVSEIAAELVPDGGAALFMYATPAAYIQSILAGENSRKELAMLANWRTQRMKDRVGDLPDSRRSEAHLAAAAWACEMTSLAAAEREITFARVEWADFDAMLATIQSELARTASFFHFEAPTERVAAIAAGPLMSRYSKALEYEYSPSLRRELLEEAGRDHRPSINDALVMLKRSAATSPLLARALELSHSSA